ncbi:MAG: hypothetical protein NZ903_02020 [Candidatus Micrarchaeota archaeon]|nr:hypothetical protein [Candidatus Micrarchaeota archaeon]
MIEKTRQVLSVIGWNLVIGSIMSRVERLRNIGNCPIIYVGSASTQRESKNTLKKVTKSLQIGTPPCIQYWFCDTSVGNLSLARRFQRILYVKKKSLKEITKLWMMASFHR